MAGPLLPLAEAQARLIALAPRLPLEQRAVAEARGHYLTADVAALTSRPAAATSAMDGFAVRASDGPGPWHVVGESAAGHPYDACLANGMAVRIATGALLPADADTVVIQEDCTREGDRLTLVAAMPATGAHVRQEGSDFRRGDLLMEAGALLSPGAIALLLAAGHARLPLRQPPRIALIDSGDELVPAGNATGPAQATASNAAMLAAMLAGLPAHISIMDPVPDRLDELAGALESCAGADIVVTSGGASVGDHDLVRPALATIGARLDFWKVAVRPGKPLLVAEREASDRHQLILGLPGNPASAFVTAWLFLLPVVRATLGATQPLPRLIPARLSAPLPPTKARAEFLRARWDGASVAPMPFQDSGALRPLAAANALIARAPSAPAEPAGAQVMIHCLELGGIA